ncbi:MAG: protoporphyrinogen oxidase [Deltaproteobacteria bacterium]|nr:MAG: protoporphyrinogen oxidase [Deltaproteobacteria bacterium]
MKRVVVVGGGISGLATAIYLELLAAERDFPLSVTVLEKEPLPGGKMRTTRDEGYLVEWGPNGFLTNKPDTLSLVEKIGIEDRLYPSSDRARRRFLCLGGKLHLLPEKPGQFFTSPLLSAAGKLRVLLEPFIPPAPPGKEETLAEFARRRLGQEALEKLIEPMAAGIYAGNPEEMSLRHCFPLVHSLEKEHGSLIRGMLAKVKERKKRGESASASAGPGGVLTSFDGGVQTLVEEIAAKTGCRMVTGAGVNALERNPAGFFLVRGSREGEDFSLEAEAVVVSTPAYSASRIAAALDPDLSHALSSIPYAPISVVAASFDRAGLEETLNGFGYLVPRREGRKVLGVLFDSSIFPNRAPEGKALLRGMVGGARNPDLALLPEEDIVEIFLQEIAETLGIRKTPEKTWFFRHERGIPQYTRDHGKKLEVIRKKERENPGLFFNNNAYEGIGLNDCVRNGRLTAEKVLDFLSDTE